jgi:hypothetical protein
MGWTSRTSRLNALGLLVAATLLAAGCSSGSQHGDGGEITGVPLTMSAALQAMPVGNYFAPVWLSDSKQLYAMDGGTSIHGRLADYADLGDLTFGLYNNAPQLVSPLTVTSAVSLGPLGDQATMLYGAFDTAAVEKQLKTVGFRQHGTKDGATLWQFDPSDASVGPTGASINPLGNGTLDAVAVSAAKIVFAPSMSQVQAIVTSSAKPLSSLARLTPIASCLGSAQAAEIEFQPIAVGQTGPLIGIGLTAGSAQDATEEICVGEPTTAAATAVEAHWITELRTGTSKRLGARWSTVLADPQATTTSTSPVTVRLTAEPIGKTASVLQDEQSFSIPDMEQLLDLPSTAS